MSRNDNLVRTIEIKDKTGRVIGTKEVVTYPGLLNLGHDEGLVRIDTTLLQTPSEANEHTAVVSASVETKRGVFKAHGDASPDNVNSRIAPHIIRMAETRAKARALRDAVNIGVVSVEELGLDGNGELTDPDLSTRPQQRARTTKASVPPAAENRSDGPRGSGNGTRSRMPTGRSAEPTPKPSGVDTGMRNSDSAMTDAQRRYLFRLLADLGIEGDSAHEYIKEHCEVESLKDVSKVQASGLIEELLKDAKDEEVKAA